MRAVGMVSTLLVACTGSAQLSEPQRTRSAVAPPAAALVEECDCACQGQSCEAAVSTPQEPTIIPTGFWCAESREAADSSPLNVCYSTEGTCKKLRKEGLASGYLMSACRSREAAYCFTATDADSQRVHWRCYETLDECLPLRKKAIDQQPTLPFSECGLTNPSPLRKKQQTAAR